MSLDSIKAVSEMRVFTEGGIELDAKTDKKAIDGFLNRDYVEKTANGITYALSRFTEPAIEDYQGPEFKFYGAGTIKYAADIIGVKKYDDVTVMKSAVTNPVKDDPIVQSDLFKYKFALNSDGSYHYQYVVHKKSDQSLEVSLLYYKLVRYDDEGNRKQLAFGKVHNELNQPFVQTLKKSDTLAVKAYRLVYSVKE